MRILLMITSLLLIIACEKQTPAPDEPTENFAQPSIDAYRKAEEVQNTVNTTENQRKEDMIEEGL